MTDKTDRREKVKQLRNFICMTMAGMGITRSSDVRGQAFDAHLKAGEFRKSGLHDVATAYMENVRRLHAHADIPARFFDFGRVFQNVYLEICGELGVQPSEIDQTLGAPKDMEAYVKVSQAVMDWLFGESHRNTLFGTPPIAFEVAGIVMLDHRDVRTFIETRYGNRNVDAQIDSLCGSLVIEAWTMFEGLCEDLWEAALNFHPVGLSELKGKPRGTASPAEATVKIRFDDLQFNRFDIKDKMGTIRKVDASFRSLAGIRESYRRAFFEKHQSIDDILYDEGLDYAAAVRNLLIHKQGIVDKEFREQTARVTDAIRPQVGEVFPMSGEVCQRLTDSCRCCAGWLINAVHAWIIGHPA